MFNGHVHRMASRLTEMINHQTQVVIDLGAAHSKNPSLLNRIAFHRASVLRQSWRECLTNLRRGSEVDLDAIRTCCSHHIRLVMILRRQTTSTAKQVKYDTKIRDTEDTLRAMLKMFAVHKHTFGMQRGNYQAIDVLIKDKLKSLNDAMVMAKSGISVWVRQSKLRAGEMDHTDIQENLRRLQNRVSDLKAKIKRLQSHHRAFRQSWKGL